MGEMMVMDKGKVIVEGSDYLRDIACQRQHRGGVNLLFEGVDDDEVDEDYKVFLDELEASVQRGNENNVDTGTQGEDDYDPHYKLFFENLKPRGTAYVLEIASRNDTLVVKYEDKDEDELKSSDELRRKTPNHRRKSSSKIGHKLGPEDADLPDQKSKWETRDDKMDKTYSVFLSGLRMVGESLVFVDKDGSQYRYGESTDESTSDSDTEGLAKPLLSGSKRTADHSKKVLGSAKPLLSGSRRTADHSKKTLRLAKPPLSGSKATSESDTEGSAKPPLSGNKRTAYHSKRTQGSFDKTASSNQRTVESSSSGFRQSAMDILAEPYDPKEHDYLLKQVKSRKPIVRSRETRGRSVSFLDYKNLGKSYLDYHHDLKKKIKEAQRDGPHKVLHLLRGFFFWLQHVSDEDQFKPWKDDLWLEALQRSS